MLKASIGQFGDLGKITFNETSGRLIVGHQRIKTLPPEIEIVIKKRLEISTDAGTSAEGFFIHNHEIFPVRFVKWDEPTEEAAMIAANQQGGEWDLPNLTGLALDLEALNIPMEIVGFNHEELEKLVSPAKPKKKGIKNCPHCGRDL